MRAKELVVVGLAADMCVQLTTAEAYMHGYSAWVPSDCTAAESPEAKRRALKYMATVMKCRTQSSVARAAAGRSTASAPRGHAVRP